MARMMGGSMLGGSSGGTVIAMMARDEETRLEAWILYHARIAGLENLIILDNGSTSPAVRRILSTYARWGVRVEYDHLGYESFIRKGEIIGSSFKSMQREDEQRIFIPLDCDEFLAIRLDDGQVEYSPVAIQTYLAGLSIKPAVYVIGEARANILGHPGHFFPPYDHHKVFFSSGACSIMDEGFHNIVEPNGAPKIQTDLIHLHFHYRPHTDMKRQSKWKLEAQNLDLTGDLSAYNGPGHHVKQYLTMDEKAYQAAFKMDGILPGGVSGFIDYMKSIGIGSEFFNSI